MKLYNYRGVLVNKDSLFLENTAFYSGFDAEAETNYTIFRINKKKNDGTEQYPFVRYYTARTTAYDLAIEEGWDFVINAGIGEGMIIENSIVKTDEPATNQQGAMPLTIDSNGMLGYVAANTTDMGATYVGQGIVSAVCGFFPIIYDYEEYNYPTNIPETFESQNWVRAQRQIIGQYGNGDYCVITSDGRNFNGSVGFTIQQAQSLCKNLGLKFAYNLDGGGSTQTVIGQRQINPVYEGTNGRLRQLFITFNGSTTFSTNN